MKKTGKRISGRWPLYLIVAITVLVLLSWGAFMARSADDSTDVSLPTAVSHGGPVKNYVSFIDNLRGQGATVEPKGDAAQTFFSGSGYIISVNGQDVQIFEYPDNSAVKKDADKISSDGSTIENSKVMWRDSPHFYQKEKIIVLYVGSDSKTIEILTKTLGNQFAGR